MIAQAKNPAKVPVNQFSFKINTTLNYYVLQKRVTLNKEN